MKKNLQIKEKEKNTKLRLILRSPTTTPLHNMSSASMLIQKTLDHLCTLHALPSASRGRLILVMVTPFHHGSFCFVPSSSKWFISSSSSSSSSVYERVETHQPRKKRDRKEISEEEETQTTKKQNRKEISEEEVPHQPRKK